MAPTAQVKKVEIMQKYKNRLRHTLTELMILSIVNATDIFAVARATMPKGWIIQFSFRTDEMSEACR